eukprot:252410_1
MSISITWFSFGAALSVIFVTISIVLWLYAVTQHKQCNKLCGISYITMMSFMLAEIGCLIDFIYLSQEREKYHLIGLIMKSVCWIMSLCLMLISYMMRFILTFSQQIDRCTQYIIYLIWILIAILIILGIHNTSMLTFYALNNNIYGMPYYVKRISTIWTCLFVIISLILLRIFMKNVIKLYNALPNNMRHEDASKREKLIKTGLRLKVLVVISCVSSFISLGFHAIMSFYINPITFRIFSQFIVLLDNFIGFLCVLFTVKYANKLYQKTCYVCSECIDGTIVFLCVKHEESSETNVISTLEVMSLSNSSQDNDDDDQT